MRKKTSSHKGKLAPASTAATVRGTLASLLERLLGPASSEAGEILHNELKSFQARRLLTLSEHLEKDLKSRRVTLSVARKLPFGLGTRLLKEASLEDDDDVLAMWAKLTASAIDPKAPSLNKVLVSILADISALEVGVLRYLWDDLNSSRGVDPDLYFKATFDELALAVHSLLRQRCVQFKVDAERYESLPFDRQRFFMSDDGDGTLGHIEDKLNALRDLIGAVSHGPERNLAYRFSSLISQIELTELGRALMERCEPRKKR